MDNTVLEKLCDKIVDVVNEIFTNKYCFLKISQSKKGQEKHVLHRKILDVFRIVFNWFSEKNKFINKHYFFNFKVLKECSN